MALTATDSLMQGVESAMRSKAGPDLHSVDELRIPSRRELGAPHQRDVMSEIASTVPANSLRFIRFENEPVIFSKPSKIRGRMRIAATGAQSEIFFFADLDRKCEKAVVPKRATNAAKYPR